MAAAQRQAEQSGWRATAGESSSLLPQLEAGKTGTSSTNNQMLGVSVTDVYIICIYST